MELSFAVVARFFACHKVFFLSVFLCTFVASCLYLGSRQDKYLARSVFMPVTAEGVARGLALPSGLSSLMGGANVSAPLEFDQFINSFGSMRLATALSHNEKLMQTVFQSQWDHAAQQWSPPRSAVFNVVAAIKELVGRPAWRQPSAFELRDYLERTISVEQVPKSNFWQISFEHSDPEFAKRFLSTAMRSLDELLRKRRWADLQERERFLRAKIASEENIAVRDAVYDLLSSNLSMQVELQGRSHYAIAVIDPVYVFPDPVSPRPALVIVVSFLLSFSLATIVILALGLRRFLQRII